jgi:hypothetical protein
VTSQPPREDKLAPEVRRGTKVESGGEVTSQPHKAGQVIHPRAGLVGQRAVIKTELSQLAGGTANQKELHL